MHDKQERPSLLSLEELYVAVLARYTGSVRPCETWESTNAIRKPHMDGPSSYFDYASTDFMLIDEHAFIKDTHSLLYEWIKSCFYEPDKTSKNIRFNTSLRPGL